MTFNILRVLQHALMAAGLVLVAASGIAMLDGAVSSRAALAAFDQAQADLGRLRGDDNVDFSLWSEQRVRAYKESLSNDTKLPWAVLGISKLRIRVAVFDGTDDLILNRGAGWIVGTAKPGQAGNIGIAGHRDGFFRGLKDILIGDAIELTTLDERTTYVVDQIEIVHPERVEVLGPRAAPSLTLVTCYPFYFVGDAPQRFIVHATLSRTVRNEPLDSPGDARE